MSKCKIHIYSTEPLVADLIKRGLKQHVVRTYTNDELPALDFSHKHVVLIHYEEGFQKILDQASALHAAAKCVLLVSPSDLVRVTNKHALTILITPVCHLDLFASMNSSCIIPLSNVVALNTELKVLVCIEGERINTVPLTDKEFALLLSLHNEGVLEKKAILESVFGYKEDVDTYTVETHISRLRAKVGKYLEVSTIGGKYQLLVK
jgi:hypothetical protein